MINSTDLLLVVVAYHPSQQEVDDLSSCLSNLPSNIKFAVIANDYIEDEPVSRLSTNAIKFISSSTNLGYSKAANLLISSFTQLPPYIAILNTDLIWIPGTFTAILDWLFLHQDVCLAVPQILNENGEIEFLCKQNPTLLALLSRRFLHSRLKPKWLKSYDSWYCMKSYDYTTVFESSYLSGCCMVIKASAFVESGGFDERYFLYLEDADLTRKLSGFGRCVHLPSAEVTHNWGRGNHKSVRLSIVNIVSACKYFLKWGLTFW